MDGRSAPRRSGLRHQSIHKSDVIDALKCIKVQVYRGARLQVKMPKVVEGEEVTEMVPMGTGAMTDRLNFVVKPMHSSVAEFTWPPEIAVMTKSGDTFMCKYRLGGEGAKLLHATYSGCKGLLSACLPDCGVSKKWEQKERVNPGKEAAERRKERSDEGKALFMASFLKPEIECEHFAIGQCVRGSKCGNLHGGGNHIRDGSLVPAWEEIVCNLPTHASGWCKAQPNCVYKDCARLRRESNKAKKASAGSSSHINHV